jgi:Mn2+/Fe2+ NRAMP family transporter
MTQADQSISKKPRNMLLRLLGPGLVTGAADDDPSGIAAYSQAGAQFGYGLLWTVFLTTPTSRQRHGACAALDRAGSHFSFGSS